MQTNICFLGEDFSFSSDIKEYISVSELANNIHATLKGVFVSKLNRSNVSFLDVGSLDADIRVQTDRFIQRLCHNGIFTHTIDEYINSNPAYSLIDEVNKAASKACCAFLAEEIENFQYGMQSAETAALSQITGSGVSVFSDSILTHAATSAMECAILKNQYNKADAQYKRNIQNISDYGEQVRIAKETEYVKSTYIPQMDKALYLFSYALMDKYLKDMIAEKKFDSSALDNVDYNKSMGILGNLKHIGDTEGIISCIKQAFIACPFNPNVYLYAASTTSFDYETYKAAEYFGVEKQFLSDLKNNICISSTNLYEEVDRYSPLITAYSISIGVDETSLLEELTTSIYRDTVSKYTKLQKMASSKKSVEHHVAKMNQTTLIDMSESGIIDYVTNLVKGIISPKNYEVLIEKCGHSDLPELISPHNVEGEFANKDAIDEYYISVISKTMKNVIVDKQNEIHTKEEERKKNDEIKHNLTQKKNRIIRRINTLIFSILLLLPIIVSIVASAVFVEDIKKVTESHISEVVERAQSKLGSKLEYDINSLNIQKAGINSLVATGKITFYRISQVDYKGCIYINSSLDWIRDDFHKYLLLDKYNNLYFRFDVHIIDDDGNDTIVEKSFLFGDERPISILDNYWGLYLLYYVAIVIVFLSIRKAHKVDIKK